jgi:hypothetical protein|tara:strand:- start:107 stop:352 length:246 start_codon:yes stop_codon:yes gene_type:complete
MNERIRLLAEQAGLQLGTVLENYTTPVKTITMEQRKFAELIVRECIQSIENTIQTNCETDSEKMGCEFAITDLLEHFGVEL